jgi:hypothetical protein
VIVRVKRKPSKTVKTDNELPYIECNLPLTDSFLTVLADSLSIDRDCDGIIDNNLLSFFRAILGVSENSR